MVTENDISSITITMLPDGRIRCAIFTKSNNSYIKVYPFSRVRLNELIGLITRLAIIIT